MLIINGFDAADADNDGSCHGDSGHGLYYVIMMFGVTIKVGVISSPLLRRTKNSCPHHANVLS